MILGRKLKNFIQNWKKFLAESAEVDSAHAVLIKNGQILIIRRSKTDQWKPHHYAFPGGKIENSEDVLSGLARECKEEINLTIEPQNFKFLQSISDRLGHKFYLATQFDGEIRLNNEHDDFKWVNPKELSNFNTVPDVQIVIKAALESI